MFIFERRLGYSLIQIYAPTALIVVLSWLSFWISKDAVPARVALVVTTVLTIVTLMGSFRSSVPKVSYVKALDVFFIISLLFVFGAVLEYVIVRLHSKKIETKRREEDETMGCEIKLLKREDNGGDSEDLDAQEIRLSGSQVNAVEQPRMLNKAKMQRKLKIACVKSDASVIDRVSRILFPVAYISFNIFYWSYYSVLSFDGI